jgi:hypothetical protein
MAAHLGMPGCVPVVAESVQGLPNLRKFACFLRDKEVGNGRRYARSLNRHLLGQRKRLVVVSANVASSHACGLLAGQ